MIKACEGMKFMRDKTHICCEYFFFDRQIKLLAQGFIPCSIN